MICCSSISAALESMCHTNLGTGLQVAKQRNRAAMVLHIKDRQELLIHPQSGIDPGWSGAAGLGKLGVEGSDLAQGGEMQESKHYGVVFLCFYRLPS